MNKLKYTSIISMLLIVLLAFSFTGVVAQDDDHGGHDSAEDQCDNPTQEVHITADPDNDGSNTYSQTTITTTPGACLMVEFENASADDEHSFVIDAEETSLDHTVHLHIMNSSMGHKMVNLQMPSIETTIPFFCNVSDHADDGMVGQILVQAEDDSFLPGFGFASAIATLTTMMIAIVILRKKN